MKPNKYVYPGVRWATNPIANPTSSIFSAVLSLITRWINALMVSNWQLTNWACILRQIRASHFFAALLPFFSHLSYFLSDRGGYNPNYRSAVSMHAYLQFTECILNKKHRHTNREREWEREIELRTSLTSWSVEKPCFNMVAPTYIATSILSAKLWMAFVKLIPPALCPTNITCEKPLIKFFHAYNS